MAKKKSNRVKSYKPTIVNRKARHEYHFVQTYEAGMVLTGTEIKSIRDSKIQLAEAYCLINDGELWVRDMHISPYGHGNQFNVNPRRERKLLLNQREIKKLKEGLDEQGLTIIPIKLFFSKRNMAKLEIALAKGKKLFDKRHDIKERDEKRNLDREMNY